MIKLLDLFLIFLAGFLINFVSNVENFYSSVRIRSSYSAIVGFICWMLTGLVFADILTSSENKFWLVFVLSLGGALGNFFSARLLKLFSKAKISKKTQNLFKVRRKINKSFIIKKIPIVKSRFAR